MKLVTVLSVLIASIIFIKMNFMNNTKNELVFAAVGLPYSSDPMDYDAFIHHNSFTSVLGTLTSAGKKGEVVPVLAKNWKHNEDMKTWSFFLRNNLKYENGDLITAKDYELSLKRVAFLMRKANSHSGLMEFLDGFENFHSISDVHSIKSNGDELVFNFSKPVNDLPLRLAFGFYALAHPSLFNHESGEWLDKKKTISSYNYKISKWTNDDFVLSLRSDFNQSDDLFKTIRFIDLNNVKNQDHLKNVDIALSNDQSLMFDENFKFAGSTAGFSIAYAQCYGWNDQNRPTSNIKIRKWLRSNFYSNLKENGIHSNGVFFPLSLYGGKFQANTAEPVAEISKKINLATHTMKSGPKIKENETKLSLQEKLGNSLKDLKSEKVNLNIIVFNNETKIEDVVDVAVNGTGIDADSFVDTARFMFVSKHGASLPDFSGKILLELKKENPNMDLINEEIWNQAIIWPILHYTSGHWINKKSQINFANVDLNLPALDFSFVKRN